MVIAQVRRANGPCCPSPHRLLRLAPRVPLTSHSSSSVWVRVAAVAAAAAKLIAPVLCMAKLGSSRSSQAVEPAVVSQPKACAVARRNRLSAAAAVAAVRRSGPGAASLAAPSKAAVPSLPKATRLLRRGWLAWVAPAKLVTTGSAPHWKAVLPSLRGRHRRSTPMSLWAAEALQGAAVELLRRSWRGHRAGSASGAP